MENISQNNNLLNENQPLIDKNISSNIDIDSLTTKEVLDNILNSESKILI